MSFSTNAEQFVCAVNVHTDLPPTSQCVKRNPPEDKSECFISTWTPDWATKLLSSASSASLRHVVLPQSGDAWTNNFRARSLSLLWHWLKTPGTHRHTHRKSNAYLVKSLYFTSVNPHITSVVLYRWRVSHSDWRALSFPQPRLHHFLPPPASSGSDWRPGRQTCNPCTVNVKTHKEGRSRRPTTHKQVFSNFLC